MDVCSQNEKSRRVTAQITPATPRAIKEASAIIRRGGLVAFPTETVYGLGADALNPIAVARIFEVKNRPGFDPLIVHISDPSSIAMLTSSIDEKAERLIENFFPGPLTLVLPKSEIVPEIVTAGLPTVAIRMPAHPVALALIKGAERPIAAPSANPFGYLSPTTAVHVKEQLGEEVDMILDGGRSPIGIESTVVEILGDDLFILRLGGLTVDEIEEVIGEVKISTANRRRPHSPGQLPHHYSPRTPIKVIKYKEKEEILEEVRKGKRKRERKRAGLLAFRRPEDKDELLPYETVEVLSPDGDLKEAAANLFACLHKLDKAKLDIIYAEPVPEVGLGRAIMDRLYRAEGSNKIKTKPGSTPLIFILFFTLTLTLSLALTLILLTPEAGAVAKSSDNISILYTDASGGGGGGVDADVSLLLITEIYANTATRNEHDEYLAITNPTTNPVNIEGWSITDNEGRIIFPFFEILPGQTIYVTRNASAFVALWSTTRTGIREAIIPDFEYGTDSDPEVTQMQREGRAFALRNKGDEVILLDKSRRKVDIVIYGDSEYQCESGEWRDEPLKKPGDGMIFIRKGLQDTNQREDWLILPIGASYHAPAKFFLSGDGDRDGDAIATAFVSPDSSFALLQAELNNAQSSLYINIYQFESPHLMDLVLDAINRGVRVRLLLEGSPPRGITDAGLYIAARIKEGGGEVRLSDEPFLNHAKYALIDNKTSIVISENWKNTGIPVETSFGNRGWGIVLRDEEVADYFTRVFLDDFYRAKEFPLAIDIETETEDSRFKYEDGFTITRTIPVGNYTPVFESLTIHGNLTVIPVLAPDTAMSNETILGMINSAEETIFVKQFSTGRFWGVEPNPFIAALIEAAKRGCKVKVLLDSRRYNLDDWNDNDEAMAWMNSVAREENLSLYAELADLDLLGLQKIHNKGLIVDGKVVIISSLNWNARSIRNREVGVIVENSAIAAFYTDVFFHDWNISVKGEREGEGEWYGGERSPTWIRIGLVVLTLLGSFLIFGIVKRYQRL